MGIRDEIIELPAVQVDAQWYDTSLQIWHDGTKYAGRLWFMGAGTGEGGMPGRRLFYGLTRDEVVERVRELSNEELRGQFRHAMTDRRRYMPLRMATDEILHQIRQLNHIAVQWRLGSAPAEQAEQEMDAIEARLHAIVDRLREVAGVEDLPE